MKYVVIFILAVTLLSVACKKKGTTTHCYICNQYDSFQRVSGGGAYFANGSLDTECDQTQDLINFYELSHVIPDTFYRNTDTMGYGYTTVRCIFYK